MLTVPFTYGSVCSGAEAFGPEWHRLDMVPVFHAETDYHAANVLRFHYPHVHNYGDFTTIPGSAGRTDLLCGGTPCKHDSVAGLREGDDGIDGHLATEFIELAHRLGAPWVLWENVAGALSTDGGRRFGAFLGALGKRGYGWAYRVLDAQYFGVPQDRRRVFVVGYLGDSRPAGAVLFEPEGLRRHLAPRRSSRAHIAGTLTARPGSSSGPAGGRTAAWDNRIVADHTGPLTASYGVKGATQVDVAVAGQLVTEAQASFFGGGSSTEINKSPALLGHNGRRDDYDTEALVMQCHGSDVGKMGSLTAGSGSVSGGIPFTVSQRLRYGSSHQDVMHFPEGKLGNLVAGTHDNAGSYTKTFVAGRVRRLTERECERLMGWADDWTRYGTRPDGTTYELPAGARYRICGNGWVAPNASWIAQRIQHINSLISPAA